MQGLADWLDIRNGNYLFKTAFLGHFDLKNSKTCLICYLLDIFTLPVYSALAVTTNKCPSKGLSEKLSPARDIARARGAVKKRGKIERSFDLANFNENSSNLACSD